jgi:hypothetical protein
MTCATAEIIRETLRKAKKKQYKKMKRMKGHEDYPWLKRRQVLRSCCIKEFNVK